MNKFRVGVIISTTREGRFADKPAQWVIDHLGQRPDIAGEIIDLRRHALPFFDETSSPMFAAPASLAARRLAAEIDQMDGFVFVTAEYNHGIPAVLKNALDYTYREFNRKPAAFVGYGGVGAARAIEQLRLICIQLQLAPLGAAVHVGMEPYQAVAKGEKQLGDFGYLNEGANRLIEDLVWWTRALAHARRAKEINAVASG